MMDIFDKLIDNIWLVLGGLMGIFMLIPGDQPEKFLQTILNVISKFSRKPK